MKEINILDRFLKSKLKGHLDCDTWVEEEKAKYLKYIPKTVSSILDVGCGRGELSWLLRKKGFDVQGCDIDHMCINKTRRFIEKVKYADVEKLSLYYSANSFDLITCLHVLEHCKCPFESLQALKNVTKKFVLIAVPNARYIAHEERDTHLYSWNIKTLSNLLHSVGFEVLHFSEDWINIFPNVIRITPFVNRLLLRQFWCPMELIALAQKPEQS